MRPSSRPTQARSIALAILLAAAMLLAQWAGHAHRIAHAHMAPSIAYALSSIDSDDSSGAQHSCAAFDAAAVGDSLHLAPYVAPNLTSARVLAQWAAFLSWDAPPDTCFLSRAPPAA